MTRELTEVASGFSCNGCALLPDGTLVVAEALGPPAPSPDLADLLADGPGAPDGACADEEGAVWVADAEHERRDTRDGRLLPARVDVPGAGLP